jgi:uridine kinase
MYQKYLDPQRQYADFTVGEETDVASLILSARIKEMLNSNRETQAHEAI